MREILFRGTCTETKQWVFGSKYNDFIISYLEVDKFLKESDLFQCNCVIRDVIPETIGQFTGLLDKNGNKIFEGDKFAGDEPGEYYAISWNKEEATFQANLYGYNVSYGEGSQEIYDDEVTCIDTNCFELSALSSDVIIGNIHDDAKL